MLAEAGVQQTLQQGCCPRWPPGFKGVFNHSTFSTDHVHSWTETVQLLGGVSVFHYTDIKLSSSTHWESRRNFGINKLRASKRTRPPVYFLQLPVKQPLTASCFWSQVTFSTQRSDPVTVWDLLLYWILYFEKVDENKWNEIFINHRLGQTYDMQWNANYSLWM